MKYRIKNVSGSDLSFNGRNLAPTQTMDVPEVSLALRTLEEKQAVTITAAIEEVKPVESPKPTTITTTRSSRMKKIKVLEPEPEPIDDEDTTAGGS